MRPYYEDGAVTIYHGDCVEVMYALELLSAWPADLCLTDPPYGVNKAEWDDSFQTDWLEEAALVSRVIGIMPGVWNIARCPERIGELPYRWTFALHLVNGMTRGALGFGNWIPCLVYARDDVSLYRQESDAARIVVGTEDKPDHPSPKPYRAMTWLVSRLSNPGELILDPFMGSGTTLRAAKDLGRRAIGIEIEERYCELAAQRMGQEVLEVA